MFLQTEDELVEATSDLLRRLRNENVVYAEIRFCPELHTNESLTSEEAVQAVLRGSTYFIDLSSVGKYHSALINLELVGTHKRSNNKI